MIESIFTILSMLVEMAAALAVALIVGKWLAKHVIIGRGGKILPGQIRLLFQEGWPEVRPGLVVQLR